ncbi:MAG: hypothetical protein ACKOWJ_01130 [Micrococcales bacterium]
MIACSFIFEPGEYDEEFHELDGQIDAYAKSLEGYIKTDRWISLDGKVRNSVYYFEDMTTMTKLGRYEQHITAKNNYAKWYKGYRIEVAEVKHTYGDGNL